LTFLFAPGSILCQSCIKKFVATSLEKFDCLAETLPDTSCLHFAHFFTELIADAFLYFGAWNAPPRFRKLTLFVFDRNDCIPCTVTDDDL